MIGTAKSNYSDDWAAFRREMPVAERWAYFDHGAVAPMSGPAATAMADLAKDSAENGDSSYPAWNTQVDNTRRLAAQLVGADVDEIALVRNTTEGINLVAEGFPWEPGDNVVTRADEFPSNLYPWLHLEQQGVEVRQVPVGDGALDLAALAAACDSRTRIVTISWVAYSNGFRHDIDELADIAHRNGALFFLDAIQGLGVFPLDVRNTPIDFLSADSHKWLLGPEGAGIFYIRREHIDRLRPTGVGWHSVVDALAFDQIDLTFKESAARFEGGTRNTPGLIAMGASLELLERFGVDSIARRIIEVTDEACDRLQRIGAVILSDRRETHKSGIVTFDLPERDPAAVRRACLDRQVVLSCRAGHLRISPHAYNNTADIDRLIEAVEAGR